MKKINSDTAEEIVKIIRRKRRQKRFGGTYYECIICLDLETTSFLYKKSIKTGYCYIFTMSVDGQVYYSRKLSKLRTLLEYVSVKMDLNERKRLMIFVHNLGFDFQFFRKYFNIIKVLAVKDREVLYALSNNGIEFRCSYALTGYSLDYLGKELGFEKLKGYNYELVRNSFTPLSEFEMQYCERDVLIMHEYLSIKAAREGGIAKFELTKTGYVRKYLREMTIYNPKYSREYYNLMKNLQMDIDEYKRLRATFMGGFTHANAHFSHETLYNLESYDIISAYPGILIGERFPMEKVDIKVKSLDELNRALDKYACNMVVRMQGVEKKFEADTYISFHKLTEITQEQQRKAIKDNGRVDTFESAVLYLTDIDYRIIRRAYKIKKIEILEAQFYRYGYLPKPLILAILKLYNDKTLLKGNDEKLIEYQLAKEYINAVYGCSVTDIVRMEYPYFDGEWQPKHKGDYETYIDQYNKSKRRVLAYQWGVWTTAYCRQRLWQLIFARPKYYAYSDTDSGKLKYAQNNIKVIDNLNSLHKRKLQEMCQYYNLDFNLCQPLGYVVGTFMIETIITRFKTLGSKRYMTEGYKVKFKNGKMEVSNKRFIELTVAGVNPERGIRYMFKQAIIDLIKENKCPIKGRYLNKDLIFGKMFDNFKLGMVFPAEEVGKTEHAYNDYMVKTTLIDYLGNSQKVEIPSSVYLAKADYKFKENKEYIEYCDDLRDILGVNLEV